MINRLMDKFYEIKSSEEVVALEAFIKAGATEQQILEYLKNNLK